MSSHIESYIHEDPMAQTQRGPDKLGLFTPKAIAKGAFMVN
jgi:hypothetical protein